jgi:predicted nucleic acid-binding Zn ribbon protein
VEKVGKVLSGCLPQSAVRPESGQRSSVTRYEGTMKQSQVVVRKASVAGLTKDTQNQPIQAAGESDAGTPTPPSRRRRRLGARTDLTKVRGILSKVLAYRGLDKRVERYEFILHWHEIVGERLAEVSKPEYIRDKALVVQVLHPAWAQELTMIKPVLLESLARYLKPGDIVRDMVFRVGTF